MFVWFACGVACMVLVLLVRDLIVDIWFMYSCWYIISLLWIDSLRLPVFDWVWCCFVRPGCFDDCVCCWFVLLLVAFMFVCLFGVWVLVLLLVFGVCAFGDLLLLFGIGLWC